MFNEFSYYNCTYANNVELDFLRREENNDDGMSSLWENTLAIESNQSMMAVNRAYFADI